MRAIGGTLAGIVVGLIVQSALGYLANMLFPMVANPLNRTQMAEAYAARPAAAAILWMALYLVSALVAAYVARTVARRQRAGWIAGGFIALMALVLAIFYPEPVWAQFGAFLAALLGTLFGCHIPLRRHPRADDGR
jgi:lysylphosphatidylglycerol synthetase-like protein (DUF2156 family)